MEVVSKLKITDVIFRRNDRKYVCCSQASCDLARYVCWRSLDTAEYYTQTRKVMNRSNTASVLADSTVTAGSVSAASSVAQLIHTKKQVA